MDFYNISPIKHLSLYMKDNLTATNGERMQNVNKGCSVKRLSLQNADNVSSAVE